MGSWNVHKPLPVEIGDKNFVAMNRQALNRGAVTTKHITEFRKQQTNFPTQKTKIKTTTRAQSAGMTTGRLRNGIVQKEEKSPEFYTETTFGRRNAPSTPIHDVVSHSYLHNALSAQQQSESQAELSKRLAKENSVGKYKQSAHTRASLGHMVSEVLMFVISSVVQIICC